MTKRSHRPEQIIKKLREAEVLLSQGSILSNSTLASIVAAGVSWIPRTWV